MPAEINFTFSFVIVAIVSLSAVGASNLQTHGTSLCPHDIAAVFVCEANGTAMFWRIRDDEGNDDVLEIDVDSEGQSVKRNGYWSTLLRKSESDQNYTFTSVLTILYTVGKELRIKCSSDLPNDTPQEVLFYYEVPGTYNTVTSSVKFQSIDISLAISLYAQEPMKIPPFETLDSRFHGNACIIHYIRV